MQNPLAVLLPISLAIFGLFGKFAFDMRRDRNYRASWGWSVCAILPGLLSAIYLTSELAVPVQLRNLLLGSLGAVVGACAAIWIGYVISEHSAMAQGSPPAQPAPAVAPTITIPGSGNILNFGSAGNITQNSEAKAREAIRDPDGIYQLDQKVATVVAARIDLSHSLVTFEEIDSPQDILDIEREFQYREYVLHTVTTPSNAGANLGGLRSRKYIDVQCTILGRINPTP